MAVNTRRYQTKTAGTDDYIEPGRMTWGRVFYVGDTDTTLGISAQDEGLGELNESSTYGVDPFRPFATLTYALARCVSGRGDTIYVMPGTAIDLTAAGALAFNKDDLTIEGLGRNNRPTFTVSGTDDTTDMNITGAGTVFRNIAWDVTGNDLVDAVIDIDAADVMFENCKFVVADSGGQANITIDVGTGSHGFTAKDCQFYGDTVGAATDTIINVSAAVTDFTLINCRMFWVGTAAVGLVNFAANCARVYMKDCYFCNYVASAARTVDFNATASTGVMINCHSQLGTIATAGSGIMPYVSDTPEGYIALIESYVVNDQGGAGEAGEAGALVGTASA